MEAENYEIDNVDRGILEALIEDSRRAYTDIADELGVSDGTVHVRVDKMKEHGIIKGSKIVVDYQALGYGVSAYIGVVLERPKDYQKVLKQISKFEEVTEAHYTTGQYGLIVKIYTKTNKDLHLFLLTQLQIVEGVRSTETIIILDSPIARELKL